ncbi:serine/threonine protein kinase [Tautonia plasticadhaerens]|uniref:Serine/threonine-protein kinase PK-1 n=1 Tax=Tautonia plasticadhaerens TaxID=2527974 RepID=A0A518H8C0_9BACT|nr:serine/threonine-protein kinase [Tautonia plasticadhaerens]QDV37051.1 Serine/threonine-protein kinase PK-1 [Tautonia plasticadhaerens]
MFGKLFGSKSKETKPGKKSPELPKKEKPAAVPKMKRVNLTRRFTILAETSQGTMSYVSKALDNDQKRSVCLKVQNAQKTADALARAVKEGRPPEGSIGAAIRHRNVVLTYDFGLSTKKEHWLSMEFIEGVSLNEIRKIGARDLSGKLDLLIQTADGLDAVHRCGYIHHDFGPKNVLVNRENVCKIIDFGLAVPDEPRFHRPGNRTGTLQYMAPELIRRESTDRRIDVFSFGVLAFEMVSNRLPYEMTGDQMAMIRHRMNAEPMKLAEVAPGLPADLCGVVDRALARRKEDRFSTMAEVAVALRKLKDAPGDDR